MAYRCAVTLVAGTWALFAAGVQAQGNSCDLLKTVLAERIDPSIRGYSMEAVPAKTPVAPGGKVIGTCEGGASKIVYFRFGAPQPSAGINTETANGTATAAPIATTAAPTQAAPPPPKVAPTVTAAATVVTVAAAPKAPPPTAQVVAPGNNTATPSSPAKQAPEKSAASTAPQAQATSTAAPDTSFAPPFAAVVQSGADSMVAPDTAQQPADFLAKDSMAKKWRWILALVVVAIAGGLWAWRSHHNAYDASGLPRGPRL